jgi:hypothetical protein
MASLCGTPIKGKVIRLIAVDICGTPITGAGNRQIVMSSFTKVGLSPQYEDGTEFFERTADGSLCVNQKDPPILKRFQVDTDLCAIDPDGSGMMLDARELTTTGPVSGTGFAVAEGAPVGHFSFEVWQQVAGSGACDPSGLQRYIYNALPHCLNTRLQDYAIENAKSVLSFMCETQGASLLWAPVGTPWLPAGAGGVASLNTDPSGPDHWLWNITTVAPPVAACGFKSYP